MMNNHLSVINIIVLMDDAEDDDPRIIYLFIGFCCSIFMIPGLGVPIPKMMRD